MSSDGHVQAALASGVAGKSVSRSQRAPAPLRIDDSDFVADFADGRWVVSWRWSRELPKTLQTRIGEYKCTQAPHVRERYNAEIQRWISKGWLKEWRGPIEGIIPLLAVFQPSKDKVRPVMDYRELNDFVECHTGDVIAVCGEKIREWRQLRGELKIVDLKSAYLQIHISENLWKYQVVKYKGVTYALTRLGFGLSCAPRIMTAILGKVLSMDERVRRGTDHYIDDIVVRESVLSAQELREHLARYGLESKAPEGLDGGRVLGISLRKGSGGHLEMSRGMALSEIVMDQSKLTKRGMFSLCGRLVGHYPVAGWLRPCCSFLKRLGCGGSWDEPVESSVGELANELLVRARAEDPVRGRWHVSPHGTVTVWTDASSLGMGVALEVDGSVAEDASWLRKESDHRHINVAELEAVARGINLAISWGFKTFTVATDSRTVISWMDNTVEGHRRVRTKGASEMLIKRRLGVIRDTITEFGLTVTVRFVSTTENKADRMTRVPKKWLGHRDTGEEGADVSAALATGESVEDAIWAAHLPHHLGVDRTLYLARQIRSNLTREQVKRELVGCEACQRIDPARREENLVAQGSLAVDGNWRRVAVDVTHYGAKHYLSMVDCGPSRFAIWRRLSSETAASIIAQLQGIVIERGPCDEFLLDNSTAFRSAAVEQFADEWGISLRFRAAYAPSGNGIVERNHRTIKRIAERGGISPEEATFWYNVTPRKDTDAGSVPSNGLYRYTWRVPFDVNLVKVESCEDSPFAVGDEVWVKPPIPSCTRQWSLGIVSDVVSSGRAGSRVEVDVGSRRLCMCKACVERASANKEIICQVARVEKKRSLVVKGVAIGEAGGHEAHNVPGQFLMAALDNLNFHSETEDGDNVEATTNIIYQYSSGEETADCVVRVPYDPKNFLGSIEFLMRESGIEEVLVASEIRGRVTANKVMSGKDYYKMARYHSWLAVSTLLECIRTDCEQQDKDSVVRHVGQVRNHLNSLLIVWEEFENLLGKTAKLWEMYIDMVLIFKRYINAERALEATPHVVDAKQLGLDVIAHARSTDAEKIISPKILTFAGQQKQTKKRQDSVKQIVSEEGTVTRALCFTRELKPLAKNGVNIPV
ncbi:hypothetical protein GQR58_003759 [Nymphon striatum]|nr:hypothetical protein GQR58_003759 [Nymphon striatum]